MKVWTKLKNIKLITVGTKVLFGVAIATNIFIGALIYVNLNSTETIEKTVDEVIGIRENLSLNLRDTVVKLQNDFLDLPSFFKVNPQQTIIDRIKQDYQVSEEKKYQGRSAYKSFFSRKERRDVSKGNVIVQHDGGKVFISYGVLDEMKNFTDTVMRLTLGTESPEQAYQAIANLITSRQNDGAEAGALLEKVEQLKAMVADAGLEAEETRTEILQHVESITAKEHLLAKVRKQQKDFTLYMGLLAIFANMFILFLLVRRIIERPLSALTTTIDEIQNGNFVEVPSTGRRDQIGILAEAIRKFRQALLDISEENQRKVREKQLIDDTVQTATTMIDAIESRAKELAGLSENLHNLAETTGARAENVAANAAETASNTDQVADAAIQLETVVNSLNEQVASQNTMVDEIVEKNKTSQLHMEKLGQAVKEIDSIIALVRDITEQTQLLALNATIEAARAGEAGKGFSVVATEMKELSNRTQQAASEVQHKVGAINAAGETLTHNFNEIEGHLTNLNNATSRISEGISAQNDAVSTISELAAKTSANTHNVSSTIQQVNSEAGEASDLSKKVHAYTEEIAGQLTVLLAETTRRLQQVRVENGKKADQTGSGHIVLLHARAPRSEAIAA